MPQIDPLTGERMPVADIQEWPKPISPKAQAELDAYDGSKDPPIEQPVVSFRPPQIDPETGERIGSSSPITPDNAKDAFKATVHAQMLGTTPSDAYLNRDAYDSALRERGGDDYDKGIGYAIETGFEDTPLGLIIRGKAPDPFESHSVLGNFIHDATEMVSDPLMLASAFTSEAGIGIAGFAADAGLRKLLTDQYTKGDVKNFGELADRAGSILWESAKGALQAKAGMAAGEIPVGSMIEKSAFASAAVKGLYQSAVMTTAGSLLNGQLPALQDFERSAALIVPLNLATGGAFLRSGEAKQALMDNYAENGVTPNEASRKLEAQPAVKPDLPEGLRPAIQVGEGVIDGEEGEQHTDIAARTLGTKPVTMQELEAKPELADKVLDNPVVHEQSVIDQAYKLKKEAIDSGASDDELPDRNSLKSGRGFMTPDGKFLDRNGAKKWVKDNESEVHDMWEDVVGGDAKAELHAEDYGVARFRVSGRNVAAGEPDYNSMSPDLAKFLGTAREELNAIKAGDKSASYGNSVLRTLLTGPRNMIRAEAEQVAGGLRKLIPEFRDQEALSFMRDYKDDPQALRTDIEEIRSGTNEKLKAFIPSMERALQPSPEMMQADAQLTDYFTKALDLQRGLGILDSTIDPSRYSPRLFMKAAEEGAKVVGKPKLTQKTPHAIQRENLRVLDPLKSGDFEARTFNALDELSIYGDRTAAAVSTKLFATELKNSALGVAGSEESHPEGWEQLRGTGLYVPKVVADAMRPMLESGGLPEKIAKTLRMQNYVKGIELSLSPFHMKAMTITAMNNMSIGDFGRALASDNDSVRFQAQEREGALWGLETTKTSTPYEAYRGLKPTSGDAPKGFDKLRELPVLKQVDAFAQSITHETFDVLQRKFKVMDFSQKQAAWLAKNPETSATEYGSAMRGIAKEVNAAYGGLNWDVMGVSKQMRDISRLFILAPDWTFSNVANLKYTGEGGPAGSAARSFWVKSFVTGIAISQAASVLISGQMSKNPTSVYLGKDKDGKEMYSNWFFAGAPKDAITLVNRVGKDGLLEGMVGFISNKFGPIASTLTGLMENKQRTGAPISKKGDTQTDKNLKQGAFAAKGLIPVPFGIASIADLLMDPKTNTSTWDYVLPLIGTYVTHEKPEGGEAPAKKSGSFHLPGVARGGARMKGGR